MIVQFEIGKTYETTKSDFYRSCGLVDVGQRFTCHHIDGSGDAWSTDVQYCGEPASSDGWCVATASELSLGYVREVTDMDFCTDYSLHCGCNYSGQGRVNGCTQRRAGYNFLRGWWSVP